MQGFACCAAASCFASSSAAEVSRHRRHSVAGPTAPAECAGIHRIHQGSGAGAGRSRAMSSEAHRRRRRTRPLPRRRPPGPRPRTPAVRQPGHVVRGDRQGLRIDAEGSSVDRLASIAAGSSALQLSAQALALRHHRLLAAQTLRRTARPRAASSTAAGSACGTYSRPSRSASHCATSDAASMSPTHPGAVAPPRPRTARGRPRSACRASAYQAGPRQATCSAPARTPSRHRRTASGRPCGSSPSGYGRHGGWWSAARQSDGACPALLQRFGDGRQDLVGLEQEDLQQLLVVVGRASSATGAAARRLQRPPAPARAHRPVARAARSARRPCRHRRQPVRRISAAPASPRSARRAASMPRRTCASVRHRRPAPSRARAPPGSAAGCRARPAPAGAAASIVSHGTIALRSAPMRDSAEPTTSTRNIHLAADGRQVRVGALVGAVDPAIARPWRGIPGVTSSKR